MNDEMPSLSGKVALVTGGASGIGDGIPLRRPQSAQDIGRACAYLAANITGEALNVSGGQQMH